MAAVGDIAPAARTARRWTEYAFPPTGRVDRVPKLFGMGHLGGLMGVLLKCGRGTATAPARGFAARGLALGSAKPRAADGDEAESPAGEQ